MHASLLTGAASTAVQVEAFVYVVRMLTSVKVTPDLDTPAYTLLKKTADYEVHESASRHTSSGDLPITMRMAHGNLSLSAGQMRLRCFVCRSPGLQVRQYSPYMVAETRMGDGDGVSGSTGFNELAGYIFGGNNRCCERTSLTRMGLHVGPTNAVQSLCAGLPTLLALDAGVSRWR